MSEPIWTNIHVRIPPSWNTGDPADPKPPEALVDIIEYLYDGYSPAEWWAEGSCWQMQGESNYGLAGEAVTEFLDWCHQHRVPYRAWDDTKYEFFGTTRVYDGGDEVDAFTNDGSEGSIVMTNREWLDLLGVNDDETVVVARVAAFFRRDREVTDLPIDHLPEKPPVDEDEAVDDDALAVL